ncbi:MAG: hypothetical protein KGQ46_11540 [Hyphomicrobiales bacterium]|nr:hypothetical protein [Hyphomicrobiales bacterium]MDE2113775.1 hypothetical protein [Hyphomicrobiales bacterium]
MDEITALHTKAYNFWISHIETQMAAWTTIALRMPDLTEDTMRMKPPSAETVRMVSEKLSAATMGALDGALAAADFSRQAMGGKLKLADYPIGFMTIAEESSKSARAKVHANARRLSKRAR